MEIYTIGFTQKTAAEFFGSLKEHGATRIVDVRLRNTSHLAGFAKRDDLEYFLREICSADYVHEPLLAPTDDLHDVPRDRFIVAGDAWTRSRADDADPDTFGLSFLKEGGFWWIASNMLRDVAALNNMEMLPWDVWGAMPAPNETPSDEVMALFDRLAELTHAPDAAFAELRARYDADDDDYRPVRGEVRSARRPFFHQLDLRAEKTWLFRTWMLGAYLDVLNVYDAENAEATQYDYRFRESTPVRGIPFLPTVGVRGQW